MKGQIVSIKRKTLYYPEKKLNILTTLCEEYGSDKEGTKEKSYYPWPWMPHNYTVYYHNIFKKNGNV